MMPDSYMYAEQKNGYIDTETFIKWLRDHFIPCSGASMEKQVLLVLDNASPHISLEAAEIASANGVHILLLPPHSSHFLHPLDLIFTHLQQGIEEQARMKMLLTCNSEVNKLKHTTHFYFLHG